MTKQAIQKLLKETTHQLTLDDFDLLDELDELANGFYGTSKTERRLLNQPFELCGILFYPLTVAKSLWYAEKVAEWELSEVQQEGLLFWLLSVPNSAEQLDIYSDPKKTDKAVKRLSRRLHCAPDEMSAVYAKCVGVTGSGGSDDVVDYGGMVASLIREYCGTPDQWLYETPIEKISDLFRAFSERVMAENEANRTSQAKQGKAVAPAPTRKLQALSEFRLKVAEIKKLWSEDGQKSC